MEVFVRGILHAEALGKKFVYRTAADFVRIRAGLPLKSVLDANELSEDTGIGGLMVVASHIASRGLGVERALVIGQLQPGVPVWETWPESRFPGMRYVIYPGNVGPPEGLAQALRSLGVRGQVV